MEETNENRQRGDYNFLTRGLIWMFLHIFMLVISSYKIDEIFD